MGGPGSGRQKEPGPTDASIRIVTSLEMWEDTVEGFNQMEHAAAAYTDTLDDGTPVVRNFADGNFVMAEQVKKAKKDTGELSKELATTIIAVQGTASALNQMTGGLRKGQAAFKGLGIGSEEGHEKFEKFVFILEAGTGPLETLLSLTTLYSTYKTVSAALTAAETTAIAANTAAVKANTVAWYANPMYLLIAGIVASILLLVWALNEMRKNWDQVSEDIDKFTDRLKGVGHVINSMSFAGILGQLEAASNAFESFVNLEFIS